MSYKSRLAEEKAKEAETQSQWNASTTTSKRELTAEDRLARKIASEVLRDNAKLKGIHSGASITKILEKEAKKQLALEKEMARGDGPIVATHNPKGEKQNDPNNLPYLHKNPAI